MKAMKARAIAVAMAMASLSFSLSASVWVTWTGAGDLDNSYGDPNNFSPSPPKGNGEYVLHVKPGYPPLHIRNSDAALASRVTLSMEAGASVYWDVTTNSVFCMGLDGSGEFFKKGGDSVLQFTHSGQLSYNAHYTVAEGTLKLPSFVGTTAPYASFVGGWCTVSNNATLVLCNADTSLTAHFRWIKCYGLLTNENPSVTHSLMQYYTDEVPSLIAGSMGGLINLRVGTGEFNIISTNCTFSQMQSRASSSTYQTVIGIAKFGMVGEGASSIGRVGTLGCEVGVAGFDTVLYRYLGRGETTDKTFEFDLDSHYAERSVNHYFGIDGGPHGGAIFTGDWKGNGTRKLFSVFRITGTNAVPCQYSGLMSSIPYSNGIYYAPHILKDGSGVWRFNERARRSWLNDVRGLTGAFSVEEGTLQFDSLGEQGECCALGTAGNLYDKYIGVYDASKKVDWAYSFGTTNASGMAEKEGTLEFVGTETAFAARRKISLLGNGRLKNSGSAVFSIRGISARAAGEHSITLDGANTMTNAVAEVSDGVAGAHVSVVKEGAGKWWLKGNTTFSGDIVVKAGELNVEANTNRFDWFRFTFRRAGSCTMPCELALYDSDGVRQNKGLTRPTGVEKGSAVRVAREFCSLNPGEMYYGSAIEQAYNVDMWRMDYLTADDTSKQCNIYYCGLNLAPIENRAFSWLPVVMRLKGTANEIASFDICQSSYAVERNPTSYIVEGSQDGLNWQVLNDTPYNAGWSLPGSHKWYSDGQGFVAGEVRKVSEGHGYAISGHPEVSSLANVRSVRVDSGATLKTEYENVGAIRGLKVSVSGGGTIDGFKFAASGAVDLVDVPEKGSFHMDVNIVNDGGTKANIADWPITINGQVDARRSARFTGSGFDILEYGLIMIVK